MKPNPEPREHILHSDTPFRRLDKFLAERFPGLSRSQLQKLIEEGNVTVNNKNSKPHQDLKTGDIVKILLPPEQPSTPQAEPIPLDIVYEDDDVIVVNKPAGMSMHPAAGHYSNTLVNALLARFPTLADSGEPMRPGIVHRLDRDTTGLTVIARNNKARENLLKQFKSRSVKKYYMALVKGKLEPETGAIEAPIGRNPVNRKKMAVVEDGREARSRYRVIKYFKKNSLVEVMPETGRTHQIRVHLAAIGYPVIGDPVYGIKMPLLKRQFLHAYKLGFNLPSNGVYREFTARLPEDLEKYLERID